MSIKVNLKVSFDHNKTAMRIKSAAEGAVAIVAQSALTDCNYYAPQDTSVLINSSLIHSTMEAEMRSMPRATEDGKAIVYAAEGSHTENGLLIWETPYARSLYYGVSKNGNSINYSKDINPNASKAWCEKAFAEHGDEWQKMMQKSLNRLLGGDE
ncbi:MAG: minor capsid protein [Ruminiclostridium sp.]